MRAHPVQRVGSQPPGDQHALRRSRRAWRPSVGVNCHDKCVEFLRRCNADESVDAFAVLGRALSDYMEAIEDGCGSIAAA